MIILSQKEYERTEHRLNSLISKGDENLSHEERMLYEELLGATLAWENQQLDDFDQKMVNRIKKGYVRKGEVLHRHEKSAELKKLKGKQ